VVKTRISKINSTKRRQFIVGFIPVFRSPNVLTRKLPEQYLSTYLSTALHRNLAFGTQIMLTHECLTRGYEVERGFENAEILCKV